MRSFTQLSYDEQTQALRNFLNRIVEAVVECRITFDDNTNNEKFQCRIDEAVIRAQNEDKPWLAGEYVMNEVGNELIGIARDQAERASYPDEADVRLILYS